MELPAGVSTSTYTYAGTGYANPHAVTGINNGSATTTYAYDNNGNLTSAGNGTATTTYTYDYANRLSAIFANGATTTFGYDAFGARVYQIASTTATRKPAGRGPDGRHYLAYRGAEPPAARAGKSGKNS